MLLTHSLRIDPNGAPHVPGSLEVWRTLFIKHPHGKYDGKLTRAASGWRTNDDLVEALFALSRKSVENEPLKIFLALSDIDRDRAQADLERAGCAIDRRASRLRCPVRAVRRFSAPERGGHYEIPRLVRGNQQKPRYAFALRHW